MVFLLVLLVFLYTSSANKDCVICYIIIDSWQCWPRAAWPPPASMLAPLTSTRRLIDRHLMEYSSPTVGANLCRRTVQVGCWWTPLERTWRRAGRRVRGKSSQRGGGEEEKEEKMSREVASGGMRCSRRDVVARTGGRVWPTPAKGQCGGRRAREWQSP